MFFLQNMTEHLNDQTISLIRTIFKPAFGIYFETQENLVETNLLFELYIKKTNLSVQF
jgi:hypothetical protein